jgi:hypothetical protein
MHEIIADGDDGKEVMLQVREPDESAFRHGGLHADVSGWQARLQFFPVAGLVPAGHHVIRINDVTARAGYLSILPFVLEICTI